jgi:hypothetical protein
MISDLLFHRRSSPKPVEFLRLVVATVDLAQAGCRRLAGRVADGSKCEELALSKFVRSSADSDR